MRRLAGAIVVLWLAFGGYGAWAYATDYYQYRGFPPPRDPPGVTAGKLVQMSFRSAALGEERSFDVYLPPGFQPGAGRRYGVMYLLHGSPGWPRLFIDVGALGVRMDTLVHRRRIQPFIVVMPDGRDGSLIGDTEWADTARGNYEGFVTDVVREVDGRLPTIADREHRLLAGNSAGAYAAANIALHHLDTFSAFEAWSGYYTQTPTGVFASASPARLRADSPLAQAANLRATIAKLPLAAKLYGGASDRDIGQLAPFVAALRRAGARVTTRVLPGRHDWRLWRSQTPAMIRWAAEQFGARGA